MTFQSAAIPGARCEAYTKISLRPLGLCTDQIDSFALRRRLFVCHCDACSMCFKIVWGGGGYFIKLILAVHLWNMRNV